MKEKNTAKKQQKEQLKLVDNVTKTYINNNSKNLKKIAEELGNPDKFEQAYREGCLNVFGTSVADQTISNIIHGNSQIKSMKTYQNSINDFVIHDMAMIMADRNYVIPQDIITDGLACKLQDAFDRFGYSTPDGEDVIYKINKDDNGNPVIDHNKIIVNPAVRVDEEALKNKGFTDEMIAEVKRIDNICKVQKEKVEEPEPREEVKTFKDKMAEKKAAKKAEKEAKKAAKEEEKKEETKAAQEPNVEPTAPAEEEKKEEKKEEPKKEPAKTAKVEEPLEEKGKLDKIVVENVQKQQEGVNLNEVIDDPLGVGKEGL